jgi:hypothetical protein
MSAGPGPKFVRMMIVNTSPIESIVDNFGNLMFIVATMADIKVRSNQTGGYSFFSVKQNTAEGIAQRYIAV